MYFQSNKIIKVNKNVCKTGKNALISMVYSNEMSIFAFENHQNFKGLMINGHSIDSNTLRQRIEAVPEDSILFRSDFPEYHAEFVGSTLSYLYLWLINCL